uniref:Uncharacterized protein n=1 Tax=Anguilla anguilla TaxID=7936 RepID=A0A0E9W052_ANGAN
MTVGFLAPQIA